jgi:hypothetical protein
MPSRKRPAPVTTTTTKTSTREDDYVNVNFQARGSTTRSNNLLLLLSVSCDDIAVFSGEEPPHRTFQHRYGEHEMSPSLTATASSSLITTTYQALMCQKTTALVAPC